ncbi:MAG: hypothetical protein N3B13_04425 [Deltaproteobacteria bacterium]|nr:hypothetical protein [Deltaproteobacteria bacterium]
MKRLIVLSVFAVIFVLYGCDDSEGGSSDAGITTESTEKYFGFSDKKTITYEGTQTVKNNTAPVTFEVTMDIDTQTLSRKTFKVTWKSSIGIPFEEWYEVKNDSVYKVAQKYTENSQEKTVIFSTPVLFGKNPLRDGENLKTETNGATYTFIISNYNYKTYKNDFGEVKRIIGSENNASNEYYLKENEGFVGFKFNNHPGLYTIDVEKKK